MSDTSLTKKEFARIMKELMTEKSFDKISIGDICQASGLSRKTFYYHFQDKYELVNWIFFTEFARVVRNNAFSDDWAFLLELCEYLHDNRMFYVHAFKITGQNCFRDYFASFFSPLVQDMMTFSFSHSTYNELYITFFTDAFLMAIARWLENGQLSPVDFVDFLKEAFRNTAKATIQRNVGRDGE